MKTTLLILATLLVSSSAMASAGLFPLLLGTEDVGHGVRCEVKAKSVVLLAQSEADCVKIGGEVTHTVKTISVPVKKTKN